MKYSIKMLVALCMLAGALAAPQSLWAGDEVWIDVRTDQEWNNGHLDGALHMPYQQIGDQIDGVIQDKDTSIKLYCKSGGRAGIAKKTLEDMGYTNVENVGGLDDARKVAGEE